MAGQKSNERVSEKSKITDPMYCVALGGSAGSLDVFEVFFAQIPKDTNCAYIVVSHFDPKTISQLSEILGKKCTIPVHRAKDHQKIEANHVYIQPEDKYLSI